jgi:hypothetical protein
MSESRVRENRMHGSMRRREATPDQSAKPRGPRTPPADPTYEARACRMWVTADVACGVASRRG